MDGNRDDSILGWLLEALAWGCLVGAIVAVLLLASCAPLKTIAPAERTTVTKFVACFATPPPVEDIDWERVSGLEREIAIKRFKAAYGDLVKWSREQYYRCLKTAEDSGIDSTTIEVTPLDAGL